MDPKRLLKFQSGNASSVYIGYGAFTTTGASVTVPCPFATVVGFLACPIGTAADTDMPLSISGTVDTSTNAAGNVQGTIARSADGTVTVVRPTGTTSGLAFYYLIFGY